MEVILQKDVKKLGKANDLVQVKAGYGHNYLIPQGLALLATPSLKKLWQNNKRQSEHKHALELKNAQHLAQELATIKLQISTKASEKGNIYGAITTLQVSQALKAKGYTISRDQISFKNHIKTLGQHQATLNLHTEIQQDLSLEIVDETTATPQKESKK